MPLTYIQTNIHTYIFLFLSFFLSFFLLWWCSFDIPPLLHKSNQDSPRRPLTREEATRVARISAPTRVPAWRRGAGATLASAASSTAFSPRITSSSPSFTISFTSSTISRSTFSMLRLRIPNSGMSFAEAAPAPSSGTRAIRDGKTTRRGIRPTFGDHALESEDASFEVVTGMHPTDTVDMAMGYVCERERKRERNKDPFSFSFSFSFCSAMAFLLLSFLHIQDTLKIIFLLTLWRLRMINTVSLWILLACNTRSFSSSFFFALFRSIFFCHYSIICK